ncbi:MAG: hypothetical protein ACKOPO_13825 [Novosphingobium sp.]
MHHSVSFLLEQVEQCRLSAEKAILPRERERFERSQAAWQKLADQRGETIAERQRIHEAKADRD